MENASKQAFQNPSDATLIQQFKDGDGEAFTALYHRHLPSVYKRVRYVVPEGDVEDVTQEVFIAASRSLASFRGDSQFGTWLRTLTNYSVAKFYRMRGRKREPLLAPLLEASGKTEGVSQKTLEDRMIIQSALQKLPDNYREILLLRLAEDMQFNEIAGLLDQNIEATKSLFRRAVAALRNLMEE
ncbi:MAG: RNA polymerase sigma factor [Chloroflexi bacterium]|nr:RNA polymerase sigma factor [Chloroflexota bacterium]